MDHPQTCELEELITESLWGTHPKVPSTIFNRGGPLPHLDSNGTNLIIVYPGRFNPPHPCHAALIEDCFSHHGVDWNVVAAIMLPIDNCKFGDKVGNNGPFWLLKYVRSAMWSDYLRFKSWAWVFNQDDERFRTFQNHLIKAAKAKGFELEFVLLCGSEDLSTNLRQQFWCQKILFSDVGRHTKFWSTATHGPVKFKGLEDWKRVRANFSQVQGKAQATTNRHFALFSNLPVPLLEALGGFTETEKAKEVFYQNQLNIICNEALESEIWTTSLIHGNQLEVRFVKKQGGHVPISSTIIWSIYKAESLDGIRRKLENRILGFPRMWRYLETNDLLKPNEEA